MTSVVVNDGDGDDNDDDNGFGSITFNCLRPKHMTFTYNKWKIHVLNIILYCWVPMNNDDDFWWCCYC